MDLQNMLHPFPLGQINKISLLILFAPLFSAISILLVGKKLFSDKGKLASFFMFLATFLATFVFLKQESDVAHHFRFEWFSLLSEGAPISFTIGVVTDQLSATLVLIVTFISFLVHLFSIEYMKGDKGYERYFMFLGIFTFSMLGLVLSDNLLVIFMFWELVGFSSYLLIGFWHRKTSAAKAAKKAFIVNRIGDFGFLIGILILYSSFGTLDLSVLQAQLHIVGMDMKWISIAGLTLFAGAIGKSAQFPLLVWLPDAMEGPTPVSALIHAATMVAAGIYLMVRVFFILQIEVLEVVACVGAITAFIAAFAAFSQNDIKKVLAFSTISQLGYMMMAIGVGAYDAAMFHLMTHAFFKACLFLCSGSIIYAMHHLENTLNGTGVNIHWDAQDMRFMGALRTKMPYTFFAYTVSAMALAGLPFFSGFLSKDAILTGAFAWAKVSFASGENIFVFLVPLLGFIAAFMTAAYMTRQILLVFYGEFRLEKYNMIAKGALEKVHDTPLLMRLPVILLSLLSLGAFYSINFLDAGSGWAKETFKTHLNDEKFAAIFMDKSNEILQAGVQYHSLVSYISVFLAFSGIIFSYFYFNPSGNYVLKYYRRFEPLSFLEKLSLNNWYLDKIYKKTVIKPVLKISDLCHVLDKKLVDGLVNFTGVSTVYFAHVLTWLDKNMVDGLINLLAYKSKILSEMTTRSQNGHIQKYLIALVLILLLLIVWIAL